MIIVSGPGQSFDLATVPSARRITDIRLIVEVERKLAEGKVKRERFVKLVTETLDSLPVEFRKRIYNLAVVVEERPRLSKRPRGPAEKAGTGKSRSLVLGVFQGVPATQRSVFDLSTGPDRIILYQKNIEAVCSSEAEIRHEIRQTVLHELGHYFGMDETQLRDV